MLPENLIHLTIHNETLKITIDGPAGSGKTTTAKKVAEKLGFLHIDSGALYRAATLQVLQTNTPLNNPELISKIVAKTDIELVYQNGQNIVLLDGKDVSQDIRMPEISENISKISPIPNVRKFLSKLQQKIAASKNIVVEGRDTGTVVFPSAQLKIFMIATLKDRVERRYKELKEKGLQVDKRDLERQIIERDKSDEEREHSPLKRPDGAIDIDTSKMTIDEQVEFVVEQANKIGVKVV